MSASNGSCIVKFDEAQKRKSLPCPLTPAKTCGVSRGLLQRFGAIAVGASVVLGGSLVWRHYQEEPHGGVAKPDFAATTVEAGVTVTSVAPSTASRPTRQIPGSSAEFPADRPMPPDGYTFARHHGEMAFGGTVARPVSDAVGPDWLRSAEALDLLVAQAVESGRGWTFGYAELASEASREALEGSLAAMGGKAVGASGRLIRARLPGNREALAAVAALDEVVGLGAVPLEVKLAGFGGNPEGQQQNGDLHVFVTLMEGDPDGTWRGRLERLGAAVGEYDADTRSYTAVASADVVRAMARADFVAAVEPVETVRAINDTAVPAMGADALYAATGSIGVFSGSAGAAVPVGVMDTGLNLNHPDIRENRESICGAYFPPAKDEEDLRVETDDLWIDAGLHGTHVTGTIVGNGTGEARFAGMAPGVRHIRFAKVLHRDGSGRGNMTRRGMDWLARESECGGAAAKPLVVNMSLSASGWHWEGRSVSERKVDSTVWKHGQLYVVAQGNGNESSFSNYGAAKNSLAVGAVHDTGDHATFTSLGPTRDGRLAPQVSGTGVDVYSARGGGSPGGYERFSGTSMAAPSVAGVAALLMDAVPAHQGNPALTRARFMASAIRPDAWMEDADVFALDNSGGPGTLQNVYGLGKASARTAVLDRDTADGWRSGSAVAEPENGEYAYVDIDVPAGASRLDLVMTWDEPPAAEIASAVLNDLDLWLDHDADCGGAECGEYSSTSRIDNVEWIVVPKPTPGKYRAKVAVRSVYTAPPRAALAWSVIRGPSTPQLRIDTNAKALGAETARDLRVSVSVDGYVSAGTQLRIDCRGADRSTACDGVEIDSVAVALNDGVWRELENPDTLTHRLHESPYFGAWFALGELAAGETRDVRMRVRSGAEPAQLRLAVDAWNAAPAVAQVNIGAGIALAPASTNDNFDEAEKIDGTEGSVKLDLYAATPEVGEPGLAANSFVHRPVSSAWYAWTAPESGVIHFGVRRPTGELSEHARVSVFDGDRPVSLREIGSDLRNVSFQAEAHRTYRIRLASFERSEDLELHWSTGRPANDDFARAASLAGASGEVAGTTVGATLEQGESWGDHAGTTWYRWTAPDDGFWGFSAVARFEGFGLTTGNASWIPRAFVFSGATRESLRLVSSHDDAQFAARAGVAYWIAVAMPDAEESGSPYELTWRRGEFSSDNDMFARSRPLPGMSSGAAEVDVDIKSSVEPDEPEETGVRTRWWTWEAPEDGLYTWWLEPPPSWRLGQLQVRAFSGASLQDLRLVGAAGLLAPHEFSVSVVAGEALQLASGFPASGPDAFNAYGMSGELSWGPTPANDTIATATLIDREYGAVTGSTRFATTDQGVRVDVVGRSAVWWTFDAPADGWYRFSAGGESGPWAVTVHDGDGTNIVASSRWQSTLKDGAEVLFYATAGSASRISVGVYGGSTGGEFTLRWDSAEAPVWLRYIGKLADGDRDRNDQPVEIRMAGELAFGGAALYMASGLGLSVFERDPESGGLTFVELVDGNLERVSLAWDGADSRLLAHDCGTWWSFEVEGDGPAVAPAVVLAAADDPAHCGRLLVHPEGTFVYRVGNSGIDVFARGNGGGLRFADRYDGHDLAGAALSVDGLLYGSSGAELIVLETDADTGELSRTDTGEPLASPWWQDEPLVATGEDGALLFVDDGEATHTFSLENPLHPERLATLPRALSMNGGDRDYRYPCVLASGRGHSALDVFCEGWGYTADWRSGVETFAETERIEAGLPDRFNHLVPNFEHPVGLAASPDGRHVYVGTAKKGILIFERVAKPGDVHRLSRPEEPDLVVVSSSVDDPTPLTGASFRFSATVRNRGKMSSNASTLRFYRSPDATISSGGIEVATQPMDRLATGEDADVSVSVVAPQSAGTHYYGVCVDPVGSESITENNCADSVEVQVRTPRPDLLVRTPSVDDATLAPGESFTLNLSVHNVGQGRLIGATTLRYYRSSDAGISVNDAEVGTDVVNGLDAGAQSDESVSLAAPSSAGTYYYGGCVDGVDGESKTTNNCSRGVEVDVSEDNRGGGGTDDHGNTFATATLAAIPSTTAGELEEGDDRDYFLVAADRATSITVETTGSTDTYGTLFDDNEGLLIEDDDSGSGVNFRIETDVAAGDYYIEVRGSANNRQGRYQLSVSE